MDLGLFHEIPHVIPESRLFRGAFGAGLALPFAERRPFRIPCTGNVGLGGGGTWWNRPPDVGKIRRALPSQNHNLEQGNISGLGPRQ